MKCAAEAQAEHEQRGEDEEDLALFRGEDVAGDVLNPAVRAELHGADEGVGDEEDEEQEGADCKAGLPPHDKPEEQGQLPHETYFHASLVKKSTPVKK